MDAQAAAGMRAELEKLAGVGQRAGSLLSGSKAKALKATATSYSNEASMLRNIASSGGRWKQHGDSRINTRIHQSAGRVERAANKLKSLHKQEQKAVRSLRAGLGIAAAAGTGAAGLKLKKNST